MLLIFLVGTLIPVTFIFEKSVIFALILYSFCNSLKRNHLAELNYSRNALAFGIYSIVPAFLLFVATIIVFTYWQNSWRSRVYLITIVEIGLVVTMIWLSFRSLRNFKFQFDKEIFRGILVFGVPLLIMLFASGFMGEIDKCLVLEYFNLNVVGLYSAAFAIGKSVNVFNSALVNAAVPDLYRSLNDGFKVREFKSVVFKYFAVISLLAVFLAVLFYYIGDQVLGEKFKEGKYITIVILIAYAFNGAYRIPGLILIYYKKVKIRALIMYISLAVNIVVSISFIDIFSMYAPAFGTLVGYFSLFIMSFIFALSIGKKYVAAIQNI